VTLHERLIEHLDRWITENDMAEQTPEVLHERIVAHLEQQAKIAQQLEPMLVRGVKTMQGGKPIQVIDCPNPECPNVFGMSGHDAGKVFCNHCGTLCVVTPG
jgi:hypothetical protein